jgi:hypothetical protein
LLLSRERRRGAGGEEEEGAVDREREEALLRWNEPASEGDSRVLLLSYHRVSRLAHPEACGGRWVWVMTHTPCMTARLWAEPARREARGPAAPLHQQQHPRGRARAPRRGADARETGV